MSATLGGVPIAKGRGTIPGYGRPWADVELSEPTAFAVGARVPLVVGGVTLATAIVSGGVLHDQAAYRLVVGPGWSRMLPRRAYMNDAKVKASLVLGDVAAECGETLAALPTTRLGGAHFERPAGLASETINALYPRGWYVETDGVTHLGARAETVYRGDAPRVQPDRGAGFVDLAPESLAGLLPGARVDGFEAATDVEWHVTPERLTVRVWAGAVLSRRQAAFAALVRASLPPSARMQGAWEFRVVQQTGNRLYLQPARAASGLADLSLVPMRPGIPGAKATVALGSIVLVSFIEGDPSRPFAWSFDDPDAPGWMPTTLELGGPGALGVARMTDAVVAGPFAGTITTGSARIKASL